ncbi:MAG: hypothetical protein RJA76_523 [Bacteroidota bacterium]|jgi:hypothetical protein
MWKMLKWIGKLKEKLNSTSRNKTEPQIKVFDFESLTPTNNADNNGLYCAALDEALSNINHYNVALTGGYGTGKSSIIETFLSKTKNYNATQVIRISLANFNFRKIEETDKRRKVIIAGRNTLANEEQIELEIGVLQQIIFQINNQSISKIFRKKIKIGHGKPFFFSALIVLTSLAAVLFWWPSLLYKWLNIPDFYLLIESIWFLGSMFLFALIGAIFLIKTIIHRLLDLRLSKFEIKSVGANFDSKESHFSLNSHLDELIYLIDKGKIKLIVFEDLDRFNDYEIFEKLREINHVLRYSPDLKHQQVKFLFVLRESIFKNENEKNKFFDLIIPVVPFISSKNSQAKMIDLFKKEINLITISDSSDRFKSVIKTSALCIDEMRTIKSIYNDYLVYLKVIEQNDQNIINLPKHELLAVVIYKNLFPLDFENINSGTSKLEQILNLRKNFLNILTKSKNDQVEVLRKQKSTTEEHNPELDKNILDIEYDIKKLKNETFTNIIRQSKKYEEFSQLVKDILYQPYPAENLNTIDVPEKYSKSELKTNLVAALILEGHINLNFKHYTSIFHEGDLSYNDRSLYMKFRTGTVFNFDQHFDSPSSFLEQFTPSDWNSMTYFCEELFDEILYDTKFNDELDIIFSKGSEYHLKFLEYYIPRTTMIQKISTHIFTNWPNFSISALSSSEFKNETFDLLLPQLLIYQDNQIVHNQNKQNKLRDYISSKQEITSIFTEDKERKSNGRNALENILESIGVKFYQLNETNQSWVLDLIFEMGLYELNMQMLTLWGRIYNEEKLIMPTYSNIMNCRFSFLKDYVNSHLIEYSNNVLFEIKSVFSTWVEDEEFLIELLNREEEIDKSKIISEIDFYEFNLDDYSDALWELIINRNKAKCTWENLITYFENYGLDESILSAINHTTWISKINYYDEQKAMDIAFDRVLNFLESLLEQNLSQNSLQILKENLIYYVPESIISANTKSDNLEVLISLRAFNPEVSIEVYEQIKTHFSNEFLHLYFAKFYSTEILNDSKNHLVFQNLSQKEFIFITGNNFTSSFFEKAAGENNYLETYTFQNQESMNILKHIKKFNYSKNNVLNVKVLQSLSMSEQINFFIWIYDERMLDLSNLNQYLVHFKGDLKGLENTHHKFKLNKSDINKRFAQILKEIGLIKDFKNEKEISFYRNQIRT